MKIAIPCKTDNGMVYEFLEFTEVQQNIFYLMEDPKHCELKKAEIYYIDLGAPVASRIQTVAEYIKNTLTRHEVEQLMEDLRVYKDS